MNEKAAKALFDQFDKAKEVRLNWLEADGEHGITLTEDEKKEVMAAIGSNIKLKVERMYKSQGGWSAGYCPVCGIRVYNMREDIHYCHGCKQDLEWCEDGTQV